MKELKAKKAMEELKGVEMSAGSDVKNDETDDFDGKQKKKKTTDQMRDYALESKAKDNNGLADLVVNDKDGTQREMLSSFKVATYDEIGSTKPKRKHS